MGLCAACSAQPGSWRGQAAAPQYAPRSRAVAQLPSVTTGGNAYQDHGGAAVALGSAPEVGDAGGQSYPDFPGGAEPPIRQGRSEVLMPNGGNRPVQSLNSLPSPP
jgi:hypothetical protein